MSGGWWGLFGFTPFIFYMAVRPLRKHWTNVAFWFMTATLLAVHILAFVAILRAYPEWRMIWFWPISIVESVSISIILDTLFTRRRR